MLLVIIWGVLCRVLVKENVGKVKFFMFEFFGVFNKERMVDCFIFGIIFWILFVIRCFVFMVFFILISNIVILF